MAARKGYRQATVETDDESGNECKTTRTCLDSGHEVKGVRPEEEDLMSTLQAQSEAIQEQDMISPLTKERNSAKLDRLSSIPEDSKIRPNYAPDEEIRRLSLGTSLQNFSFPIHETGSELSLNSPTSRASSFSMSVTSMPPSPATSHSSVASFSNIKEDRRLSHEYTTSRHSSSTWNHIPPSSSSRPRSFTNGPFPPANIGRRVSFGSCSPKVVVHQDSKVTKRQAAELFMEKALAAPLPNKYQGARGSLPRNMSFPTTHSPQRRSYGRLSEGSLSLPTTNEHGTESHRSNSPSSNGSRPRLPLRSPESSQRASLGSRSSSYTSQTRHRYSSSQPLLSPKIHQKPQDIPSKEQWRSSLKSSQASSSRTSTRASSDASDSSPRQPHSSPTSTTQLAPRQKSSSKTSCSDSSTFTSIISQLRLSNLQDYLFNIPLEQLTHYASTWSYSQTLHQFLHPDYFYLKDIDLVHRSYLSFSIRSHIYALAHTICTSQKQNKERQLEEDDSFALTVFLLRLVMFLGIEILIDAPAQHDDPTGLREVESSYMLAKEIKMLLRERDGEL